MGAEMQHGELTADRARRWCAVCRHDHGWLYPCEHYDAATLAEILEKESAVRMNLSDPAWCQRQIDNGCPPEGIAIFRFFAGLE